MARLPPKAWTVPSSPGWVMGVDVMARLHQQIQHVLVGLRDARQPNPKI